MQSIIAHSQSCDHLLLAHLTPPPSLCLPIHPLQTQPHLSQQQKTHWPNKGAQSLQYESNAVSKLIHPQQMTNKYHSRGHWPPSPGRPSCFTADKEKIVNCFFMRLIPYLCSHEKNEGKHKQLGKYSTQHSCWPEGFGLTNHFMKINGAECTFVGFIILYEPKVYKTTLRLNSCGHMEVTVTVMHFFITHVVVTQWGEKNKVYSRSPGLFKQNSVADMSVPLNCAD